MKKIVFLVTILCTLDNNAQSLIYDLNSDGSVNTADVAFLVNYLNNKGDAKSLKYDLNRDDVESARDVSILVDYVLGKHQYVDLGLSVKWATCNVGADNPEDYGLYFAWGETIGYTDNLKDGRSFDWANYKWMTQGESSCVYCTKYTYEDGYTSGCWYSPYGKYIGSTIDGVTYTNLTTLTPSDDAATVNWGRIWRMPTDAEWTELRDSCTWTLTTLNGNNVFKVTSNINGNSIFLPLSGYRSTHSTIYSVGTLGNYWTSSLCQKNSCYAIDIYFYSGAKGGSYSYRYYGESVRPVCK